ncbi:MAG: endo alpha-1,4 polygalactosaminidase [Granulosicoccus sp.]
MTLQTASKQAHYKVPLSIKWQIQLQGNLNTQYDVDLYIVDLFDTSIESIALLKSRNRKVICYFSAGSHEAWRNDASDFADSDIGRKLDNWPGERWLDVRSDTIRRIMMLRLDLAQTKGCDGVDPDNVDGYINSTGFNLTANDQLMFSRFLSQEAHARGLVIGLKNNVDHAKKLVDEFDFAVNESCELYDECDLLQVFIDQGKPVLHIEYSPELVKSADIFHAFCRRHELTRFSSLVLPVELDDSYRLSCQDI